MPPAEAAAFEADPLAAEMVALRLADDEGKVRGWQVPGLETYEPLLRSHLEAAGAEAAGAEAARPPPARRTLLFTPGPLTTSAAVKEAMLVDAGSRDTRFIALTRDVRRRLVEAAGVSGGRASGRGWGAPRGPRGPPPRAPPGGCTRSTTASHSLWPSPHAKPDRPPLTRPRRARVLRRADAGQRHLRQRGRHRLGRASRRAPARGRQRRVRRAPGRHRGAPRHRRRPP